MKFEIESVKFNEDGLVPVIAQDVSSREVLMMAWMNAESLSKTIATGKVTYWSRSRQELWEKGATSGHIQLLKDIRIDCDRDCLLMLVDQTGPACHTNRKSCFYTAIRDGIEVEISTPE